MTATLTTREIAQARRVSLSTAQRWARTGKLDAIKVGGRWVITSSADLTAFKPVQVDKARELIEQGGIVPTSRTALFLAVSTDGSANYLVDQAEHSCTCKAGARGIPCYHLAAADIIVAA
ncbi:helix-turn-helix domain-containing protein [Nonomuraea guangzhouensis]|uniref:Helix-turn-helix domain-containing protein n=1 Tax=Nonomuraea guangzhouensis TaxID=1291555 RepID=A0ABW4GY78_9ACTN|nr:helix-turn-helix domain-containing protein [Nonomuraea guangzhouensis]